MITRAMVETGIARGVIKFVPDPNRFDPKHPEALAGTVAQIGDSWFYFGGITAEDENPEDFLHSIPMDDLVEEVYDALDGFDNDYDRDEYDYYEAYLHERCDVLYTIAESNSTPLEFTDPDKFMAALWSKMSAKVNGGADHFDIKIL